MCTPQSVACFLQNGYVIERVMDSKSADQIGNSVLEEALQMAFQGEDLTAIKQQLPAGATLSHLLNNAQLRAKYCNNPKCVWQDGSTRTPILSKSCGMLNIYHNRLVRDNICFSPRVYNVISDLYKALHTGEDQRPVYLLGPDRVGVKAKGATDMDRHLDKHLLYAHCPPGRPQRVQAFCCLRVGRPNDKFGLDMRDLGSIEILQAFHSVFPLASIYFQTRVRLNERARSKFVPQVLGREFDDALPAFLKWLREVVFVPEKLAQEVDAKQLQQILQHQRELGLLGDTCPDIRWVIPEIRAGDLFCFDHRLPHRNLRNKSPIERIVAYVSLFPRAYMDMDEKLSSLRARFLGEEPSQHSGSNRSGDMERTVFASTWKARIHFEDTEISRKALAEDEPPTKKRKL